MNVVSLFAGCGGLDFGFEQAGFNVIWANENDETIHDTYRLNHPNTILNTSDIRTLTGDDIPDCDGIIGGPPCQAWSEGGKRLGIKDPRGQLFLDYVRIVKDKKPKFFLIENVQGILDEKHKQSLEGFMNELRDSGYNISYELLNAADFYVPQDRFRVFFIGIRKDFSEKFVFPKVVCISHITLRNAIGDIVENPRYYSDEIVEGNHPTRINHDVYTGPYDAKYMARNRVRGWNETSFTMQAQARNAPLHPQAPKMMFISNFQRSFVKGYEHLYRRLSVRECARIQTFPDSFRFLYKDVKDGYKMVGNAVPPRLAWYLAVQINKIFADCDKTEFGKGEFILSQQRVRQIPVCEIAKQFPTYIVDNSCVSFTKKNGELELHRRVLICLVKQDNIGKYLDHSAKLYYTGNKMPSSICLNKLYYFIPYIKGKGIRDLYLIKMVRVGSKQEIKPECPIDDIRIFFEIEYERQLFDEYRSIHLDIWHTYKDMTIEKLVKM